MRRAISDGGRLWDTMQKADARFDAELIADADAELFAPASSIG